MTWFLCEWSKLTWFQGRGCNVTWLRCRDQIDLVVVWLVEIDLQISVWASKSTWFVCGWSNLTRFSVGIGIDLGFMQWSKMTWFWCLELNLIVFCVEPSKLPRILSGDRNRLDFSGGSKLSQFLRGGSNLTSVLCGWSKLTWFQCGGLNLTWFQCLDENQLGFCVRE